jgi:hypothetical protein
MNKVKMFFVAASLLLVTAGVFAGKAKFFTAPPTLYYYDGSSYSGIILDGITTDNIFTETATSGKEAKVGSGSTTHNLYYYSGTTYHQVYNLLF